MRAIYNDISYLIKVKGGYLDPIPSTYGLKQGGVLSPSLFNIFIDDMKDIFDLACDPIRLSDTFLSHMLYADDLILLSTSMEGLNVCLEKLDTYCVTWQLEVNIKKSKVMIFNQTGRLIIGQNLFFQGQKLEIVKTYCYLGVEISCSGAFGRARDCLTEKAHKAMFPLKAMINQFQLSNENSLKLFHSFISPILLYNAENLAQLSHRQISDLEDNRKSMSECLMNSYINSNHYKFLKYVLGVKPNCSNIAILGELGEFPLMARAWIALLSYWHRSTQMGEKTLVNKALKVITENDHKQSEWLSTIKIIMSKLGLLEVFRHPSRTKSNKLNP